MVIKQQVNSNGKLKGVVKGINAGTCTITAEVDGKKLTCMVTVKKASTSNNKCYGNTNIPDFGKVVGVNYIRYYYNNGIHTYIYDILACPGNWLDKYLIELDTNGFVAYSTDKDSTSSTVYFWNDSNNKMIGLTINVNGSIMIMY